MKRLLLAAAIAALLSGCNGSTDTAKPAETAAAPPAAAPATEIAAAPAAAPVPSPSPTIDAMIMGPATGKWQLTSVMTGIKMPTMKPTEICVDKQLSLKEQQAAQLVSGTTCTDQTFTRNGDKVTGHSSCTSRDGTKTETNFTVTGDLNAAYTIETSMMRDPAPKKTPNPLVVTVTAKRLGDC